MYCKVVNASPILATETVFDFWHAVLSFALFHDRITLLPAGTRVTFGRRCITMDNITTYIHLLLGLKVGIVTHYRLE
jgi:hypothetical protein